MSAFPRPGSDEFAEYYAGYVGAVPDGDIVERLREQHEDTLTLLRAVPADRETFRYADDKWSLREVVGHLVDTERVFTYRAVTMAREDDMVLPAMDQEAWAKRSNAGQRTLRDLAAEWTAVRAATVHLFSSMAPEDAPRMGTASGYRFSVRSFPWIIAGHELWHRKLIEERYLTG